MLRAYSGAFAAVRASSRNVERADYMEHAVLKGVCRRLVFNAGIRIVENAFFACACGADVAAGVAANATGKLSLPERKAFVRRHLFNLLNLVEASAVKHFSVLAHKLVIRNVLFGLAMNASVGKEVFSLFLYDAVIKRFDFNLVALALYG